MNKSEKKNGAAFYIALCCCVAVIGLVGYIGRYASSGADKNEPAENASAELVPTSTPIMLNPTEPPDTATPVKTSAPGKSESAVQTSAEVKEKKPVKTPEPAKFGIPCSGSIIKEMSGEELEYNKVLGDWRTHNGADISADAGAQIKAVHSGTVAEIFDGALGETVITDCKNGFTVVYGCLAGTDALTVGQEIKEGDVVGTVGATGSENVTEPHLHIELIKDGQHVNPHDYIKFGE